MCSETIFLRCVCVRDALLEWKDYVRVLEMLEMETEMHLLDQVNLIGGEIRAGGASPS